jgi:thioesterase III
MEYKTEIKVRGYHADFYGHVNNARYLEFFEEDRWAHLESKIDLRKWAQMGLVFLVVNINVNYRRAVPVGETLLVSTRLEKIGNRSVVLKQEILTKDSGEVAADALITFVIADRSGRAMTMEGEVRAEIEKLQ